MRRNDDEVEVIAVKALPVHAERTPVQVGARLRNARLERRLTLDQVATLTGMTKGFLSRVERDLTSPSVASLLTLCQVLQIDVGSLFAPPATSLVRRDEAPQVHGGGVGVTEWLLTGRQRHELQVLRLMIERDGHGDRELYSLDCEVEVWHVLEGELTISLHGEEHVLAAGDTLTFQGREPHTWRNSHAGDCVVLVVLLPVAGAGR